MLKIRIVLLVTLSVLLLSNCNVDSGKDTPSIDVETIESQGMESLKKRDWDSALEYYSKSVESGNASSEGKLWWSSLTISSIIIDENIQEVVENIGLVGYPTELNEVLFTGNIQGSLKESSLAPFANITIRNSSQFSNTTESETYDMLCTILFNMQEKYPNGINNLMDSIIKAIEKMDLVNEQLLSIPDDAMITLEYSMFYPDNYEPLESNWLSEVDSTTGEISPAKLTVGKAEVYIIASTLELYRSLFLILQSISLNTNFKDYWTMFNPKNGNAYDYINNKPSKLKDDFSWSTVKNPLKDNILHSRTDALTIMENSKKHFTNFITYIDSSGKLLVSRDKNSEFFLSPNNKNIGANEWENIVLAQEFASTAASLILDSLQKNEIVYYPEDFDIQDIDSVKKYKIKENWPTIGKGICLGKFFEKPLFTLENAFELNQANGEFVFYIYDGAGYRAALKTDVNEDSQFYIKLKDITFNGLLVGLKQDIMNNINVNSNIDGNTLYIQVSKNENYLVGHSLYPEGEAFSTGSTNHISTGSFFIGKVKNHTEGI